MKRFLKNVLNFINQFYYLSRYDKEGSGAIHREEFFRICGLDSSGKPRHMVSYTPRGAAYPKQRPHSEIGHTNGMDTSTELKKILKQGGVEKLEQPLKTEEPIKPSELPEAKEVTISVPVQDTQNKQNAEESQCAQKKTEIKRQLKAVPRLENIIDCLHYKVKTCFL